MKLKRATINDFRRFKHLTVRRIPETARLIMISGPNGCGKSSFFDAIQVWHKRGILISWDKDYHANVNSSTRNYQHDSVALEFHDPLPQERKKACYVRSAYRNDPEFRIDEIKRLENPLDRVRIPRMIDNDIAVRENYQRLVGQGIEDLYEQQDGSKTFAKYREEHIGDIQRALKKLFPDLDLNSLGNPLLDGTFRFTKGESKGFAFKNLSGGEKAVFDLILDLVIARRDFGNTLFCIDEPESHMNARLQAELLSVLYDLVPENCQLMLATHSIGMMRRARDIEAKNPGSVAFLDFGGLDFDKSQTIEPIKPNRKFWERAYDVALDDLAALVAPSQVVICEGEIGKNSVDATCYEQIFGDDFPDTRFVPMGSASEIENDRRGLATALDLLVKDMKIVRLIDRDDRSEREVKELIQKGIRVLSRRNLESYLFDDEVLEALAISVRKGDKIEDILHQKQQCVLTTKHDAPVDDLKPASGKIYVACKNILEIIQSGNSPKAFMRDTLAPLIKPNMAVYKKLKCDIFGTETKS